MGLFDFLKKKEAVAHEADFKESNIDELELYVKKVEKETLAEFYKVMAEKVEHITSAIDKILDVNTELQNTLIKDKAIKQIEVRVDSAKDNFCSRNKRAIISFLAREMNIDSPEDALNYYQAVILLISELNSVGSKYGGAVGVLYKNQMDTIGRLIKQLIEIAEGIKHELDENKSVYSISELLVKSRRLKDLFLFRKKIQDEKFHLVTELDEAENNFFDIKKKREAYEQSNEYRSAQANHAEIAKFTEELNYMKILLRNKFSDFSKSLTKYRERYGTKENDGIISAYIMEPFEAFDIDSKLQGKAIIEDLRRMLEFKKLDIDERIMDKQIKAIDNLLISKEMETYFNRRSEILKKIAVLEEVIKNSGVYELNLMKVQAEKLENQIKNLDTMVEVQTELLKKNLDGIKKVIKECEQAFSQLDYKVKIQIEEEKTIKK